MPDFQSRVVPAGEKAASNQAAAENVNPSASGGSPDRTQPRADNLAMSPSAIELAKSLAAERALARAMEYDKINATERDDWYYIQGDQQFGPVPLDELKDKIADLSIDPPVSLAWHEGMEAWKAVHEISIICGVSPLASTQCFKLPKPARRPGDGEAGTGGI